MRKEIVMDDIGYTIVLMAPDHPEERYSIDFEVYEIISKDDRNLYYYNSKNDDGDTENNIEQCTKFMHGTIKWDGCSHYWFDSEEGYVHLDSIGSALDIGILMIRIQLLCRDELDVHLLDSFEEEAERYNGFRNHSSINGYLKETITINEQWCTCRGKITYHPGPIYLCLTCNKFTQSDVGSLPNEIGSLLKEAQDGKEK